MATEAHSIYSIFDLPAGSSNSSASLGFFSPLFALRRAFERYRYGYDCAYCTKGVHKNSLNESL
jgi:hypothetical protein